MSRDTRCRLVWALWVVAVGCRFGGPSGDATGYVAVGDASARTDAADATTSGEDAPGADDGGGASDALGADDAGDSRGPALDGAGGDGGPGGSPDDASCTGTVPVCDPIHNTGCATFQQCDVDPSQPNNPAGLCLFHSAPAEGGACQQTVVSETCDAQATCVAGTCRTLCFCNADCPTGQCCSDTSGPKGFHLCATCP